MPRGRPRKAVAVVKDDPVADLQEVGAADFDSNTLKFRKAVAAIIGRDQFIYLARRDPVRLSRLATGPLRMKPLRWSMLTPVQAHQLEEIVPYRGVDDLVSYGDTVIMTCPLGRQEQLIQRRMAAAQSAQEAKLTAQALSRETGLPVDEHWEDLPETAVPRR